MVDFYLITGFLGAGKTTFLKNLIRMLSHRRLRIIVNEFGREGVDGTLLAELGVAVDEISNGSIFCSCRLDKFEEVLVEALKDPPEVLLVEASGLSDPTNIRKILANQQQFAGIRFCGSICLADALRFKKVLHTARVCSKQIGVSDLVLINKTDLATAEQIAETEELIRSRFPETIIHRTSHGVIEQEWLNALHPQQRAEQLCSPAKDITLQKATIVIRETMSRYQLEQFIRMFVEDTYRVKGFACLGEERYLVDCAGAMVTITPYHLPVTENANRIVALAGQGMPLRKSISAAAQWYEAYVSSVE